MIQMKIFINDYLVNIQRSDGIIISTPTGSTAYSMSNGCSIVSPDANVISIVPVSAHTYSHRPIIVNSKDKITIEDIYNARGGYINKVKIFPFRYYIPH